ncbi:MAG TPA: GNAT family N-acetyltransferase [Gaiellaceae bacterium]|nr:GNAT family N-acetyltransferase [Gaiellaceae bacterium]
MPPEIRRVSAGEWRAFRDIRLAALLDAPDAFGSTYTESSARPEDWWRERTRLSAESDEQAMYLAWDGETPVGLAGTFFDDPDWVVIAMWVDPAHRGQGLGRLLLDAVVDFERTQGATESVLGVVDGNDAARALYERYGYQDNGVANPLREGEPLIVREMTLKL